MPRAANTAANVSSTRSRAGLSQHRHDLLVRDLVEIPSYHSPTARNTDGSRKRRRRRHSSPARGAGRRPDGRREHDARGAWRARPSERRQRRGTGGDAVVHHHHRATGDRRRARGPAVARVRRAISASCTAASSSMYSAGYAERRTARSSSTRTPGATAPIASSGLPGAPSFRGITTSSGSPESARDGDARRPRPPRDPDERVAGSTRSWRELRRAPRPPHRDRGTRPPHHPHPALPGASAPPTSMGAFPRSRGGSRWFTRTS